MAPPQTSLTPPPDARIVCAWCFRVIREGHSPELHGICPACTALDEPVESLTHVSPTELDRLPFGVIRLNGDGVVQSYNRTESVEARRTPDDVIGRNFFTDVAPCTNVRAFAGRLEAMRASGKPATERFGFVFRLPWTRCAVQLSLTYEPATDSAIVIVDWRPVDGAKS